MLSGKMFAAGAFAFFIIQAFSPEAHAMGWGIKYRKGSGSSEARNVQVLVYEGSIRDAKPVAGALIAIEGGPSATTGADGKVTLQIARGKWTANVSAEGFSPVSRLVNIKRDGKLIFNLSRADEGVQTYDFVVEVFEGNPSNNKRVPGAKVTIDGEQRTADGNGFTHFVVRSGPRNVKVTAGGFKDFEQSYNVTRPHKGTSAEPSFKVALEKNTTGGGNGTCYPRLTSATTKDKVKEAAIYIKNKFPQYFVPEATRVEAYHMMTQVINLMRHNGYESARPLNHKSLPAEPGSARWGSDAFGIKTGSNNWVIWDIYGSWPVPGNPQAYEGEEPRTDTGVEVTSDLIPVNSGTRCN